MLQRQTTSHARLIGGEIALNQKRLGEAIEAVRDGLKRHDSWFARYLLGRVYLEAGQFAEALAEFELCVKRKERRQMSSSSIHRRCDTCLTGSRERMKASIHGARPRKLRTIPEAARQRRCADPLVPDARRRLESL